MASFPNSHDQNPSAHTTLAHTHTHSVCMRINVSVIGDYNLLESRDDVFFIIVTPTI